ncbi:hypothetical protein ACFPOG_04530, partial [Paenibacillus aestuarii]
CLTHFHDLWCSACAACMANGHDSSIITLRHRPEDRLQISQLTDRIIEGLSPFDPYVAPYENINLMQEAMLFELNSRIEEAVMLMFGITGAFRIAVIRQCISCGENNNYWN